MSDHDDYELGSQQSLRFDQALPGDQAPAPGPNVPPAEAIPTGTRSEVSAAELAPRSREDFTVRARRSLRSVQELIRSNDPKARSAVDEAERVVLECDSFGMHAQICEYRAKFFEETGDIDGAKHWYLLAWQNALCLSVISDSGVEASERLLYHCIRIQNREDASFKNLLLAAKPADSPGVRCDAWFVYRDKAVGSPDRLAARVPCSVEEFRSLLDAARQKRGEG